MPELAFGYAIGFLCTALLVGLHIFLQIRKQKSIQMRFVQRNLKKIDLFWSDSESEIKKYESEGEKNDLEKSIKSILISGTAFVFMSWFGFLLQMIIMLSIRFLAVKRIERNIFSSELAEAELEASRVQEKVLLLTCST